MNKKNYGQNMMLFTSYWGDNKTFKMMPVTEDCPFTEVIYNPAVTTLVVISKVKKQNLQFIPRLDDKGDVIPVKQPRTDGRPPYKEQRINIELLQEYYLTEKEDQLVFVDTFAINTTSFKYQDFIRDIEQEAKTEPIMKVEKPKIITKA